MSTSNQYARLPIAGGINSWDSEDSLQPGQVVDSRNFLYYGSEYKTRPGIRDTPITTVSAPTGPSTWYQFAKWFPKVFAANADPGSGSNSGFGILVQGANVGGFYSPIPKDIAYASGPLFSSNTRGINASFVNGVIILGVGVGTGLIRIVPTIAGVLNNYTQIAAAPYQYVAAFSSRMVAALDLLTGENTVGWSASADETNWTTADSGKSVLVDIDGTISGLGKISNVLVVLHTKGIHLGTLTGVAPPYGPIFRFENYSANGEGCFYPGTAAFYGNQCAFVGDDDVYIYDLHQIKPIGREIRNVLLPLLDSLYKTFPGNSFLSISYKGFFCRDSYYTDPVGDPLGRLKARLQYHLVPQIGATTPAARVAIGMPHFIYDLAEQKWSIHSYNFPISSGYDAQVPAFFDTQGATLHSWDPTLPQESGASLLGPIHTIEDPEHDQKVDRVMIRYRNYGETMGVHSTVSALAQDGKVKSTTDTQLLGTPEANERWMRRWYNHNISGQDFQWLLQVDPGVRFAGNYMSYRYGSAGEFKGQV